MCLKNLIKCIKNQGVGKIVSENVMLGNLISVSLITFTWSSLSLYKLSPVFLPLWDWTLLCFAAMFFLALYLCCLSLLLILDLTSLLHTIHITVLLTSCLALHHQDGGSSHCLHIGTKSGSHSPFVLSGCDWFLFLWGKKMGPLALALIIVYLTTIP